MLRCCCAALGALTFARWPKVTKKSRAERVKNEGEEEIKLKHDVDLVVVVVVVVQ